MGYGALSYAFFAHAHVDSALSSREKKPQSMCKTNAKVNRMSNVNS